MIQVWVRREDGRISAYRVEGHAGWAESGNDIVCAAISALAIGAANGLDKVAGAAGESRSSEGLLQVELADGLDKETRLRADAILDTMLLAMDAISRQYPGRIRIYD